MCLSTLLFKLPVHEVWTNEMEGEAAAFTLVEDTEPNGSPVLQRLSGQPPPCPYHILTALSLFYNYFNYKNMLPQLALKARVHI